MPIRQFLVEAQPLQPPPQSTSVSLPFLTVSPQVGAAHLEAVQMPSTQSVPAVQALVVAQRLQLELPPQSVSLSLPFLT